jgi:hypothetical protein
MSGSWLQLLLSSRTSRVISFVAHIADRTKKDACIINQSGMWRGHSKLGYCTYSPAVPRYIL